MKDLMPQTQPTDDSCVSTCIAMVIGKPAQEVLAQFHESYAVDRDVQPDDYFNMFPGTGFGARPLLSTFAEWRSDRYYMLAVPSLNVEGVMHAVLAWLPDDGGPYKLLDPNQGKEGKRWYLPESVTPQCEAEFNLKGWQPDFEFYKIRPEEVAAGVAGQWTN